MKTLIETGKTLYWATSEWPAIRSMETVHLCDKIGAPGRSQTSASTTCSSDKSSNATTPRSSTTTTMAISFGLSGILTGKYYQGIPEGSRFANNPQYQSIFDRWLGEKVRESNIKKLNELEAIEKELGASLTQLALACTSAT